MSMKLECYKTLWGHTGSFARACQQALEAGFAGVEGPAPASGKEQDIWRQHLQDTGLLYIAEICTAGSYVPERQATVQDHLDSLEKKLQHSLPLTPQFVTCLGGCDAWDEAQSLDFFSRAMSLAQQCNISISFETHRGRSFFNPWVTARICEQLGDLQLTADFSHWCVVCERLMDVEQDVLECLLVACGIFTRASAMSRGRRLPTHAWRATSEHSKVTSTGGKKYGIASDNRATPAPR